jgi:hypothetical protein
MYSIILIYKKAIPNSNLEADNIFKTTTAYKRKWKDQVNCVAEPKQPGTV